MVRTPSVMGAHWPAGHATLLSWDCRGLCQITKYNRFIVSTRGCQIELSEPTTPPLPGTTSSPALFSTQKPARTYSDARRGCVLALALATCLVRLVADPHAIGRSAVPGVMSSQVVHALAHFSSAATAPPCIPPPQFPIPALPGCVSPLPDTALSSRTPRATASRSGQDEDRTRIGRYLSPFLRHRSSVGTNIPPLTSTALPAPHQTLHPIPSARRPTFFVRQTISIHPR
ncbi:hypothetical protein C8Q76DRAFT_468917 [Earliella scabrosa]|nr:hypothetical protein C8Q76DRAFT_468917 [Earliella scabrosa]